MIITDNQKNGYAYITKDNQTVRFFNREPNNYKVPTSCRISELSKIALSESKDFVEVLFKDNEKGKYYPKPELNPVDEIINQIIPDKPIYDGSITSIEEILHYTFTEKQILKCIFFNELDNKIYVNYELFGQSGTYPYCADNELTTITQILEKTMQYEDKGLIKRPKISLDKVDKVLSKIAKSNHKNPFLEMVKSAAANPIYDFKIESFLSDVGISSRLGDYEKDKKYIESVSCALFLSIIERQMINDDERSIKFVPVIIGQTNLGKSTICKKLGLTEFYRESTVSIADEKAYNESVQGSVIVEQAEGTHFVAGFEEKYKAHFDKNSYLYRKSYARESVKIQKRYIEMITSNDNEILTDITGNVRYFPIFLDDLGKPLIPIQEHTKEMILSYYADAYNRYLSGERWYNYIDDELQTIANVIRESVTKEIDGLNEIMDFVDEKCPIIGDFVTRDEIKEYLRKNTILDWQKIDKAIRLFGKSCDIRGFRQPNPRTMIIGGKKTTKRGFERFREMS